MCKILHSFDFEQRSCLNFFCFQNSSGHFGIAVCYDDRILSKEQFASFVEHIMIDAEQESWHEAADEST